MFRGLNENIFGRFEFLDHTADVQLHGWGKTMQHALEATAVAMFAVMTSVDSIQMTQR